MLKVSKRRVREFTEALAALMPGYAVHESVLAGHYHLHSKTEHWRPRFVVTANAIRGVDIHHNRHVSTLELSETALIPYGIEVNAARMGDVAAVVKRINEVLIPALTPIHTQDIAGKYPHTRPTK